MNGTVAASLWDALIGTELWVVKCLDRVRERPEHPQGLGRVTALVKTFERPRTLRRLLASIRRFYPDLPVLVVDDSREPTKLPGTDTLTLPFDSGVSAGRAAGLERITTPYTLLLDDDYVFHAGTCLAPPLATLDANPAIDLVAGKRIDLPLFRVADPRGALWPTRATPLRPLGSTMGGLPVVDKAPNCYLARTNSLRKVGWDPEVKRLDHADFFTRALGRIICVQDHRWSVLHAKTPFDTGYMARRMDIETDLAYLRKKWS